MPLVRMSSSVMPTARWVFPVPIWPMINSPVPSRGSYSCANLDGGEIGERQRRMGSRKVGGVAGEFAMLVSLGNARCGQQRLIPRTQLTIAARDAAVFSCGAVFCGATKGWAGRNSLPTSVCAQRAYAFLSLGEFQTCFFAPSQFHSAQLASSQTLSSDFAPACPVPASAKPSIPVYNL